MHWDLWRDLTILYAKIFLTEESSFIGRFGCSGWVSLYFLKHSSNICMSGALQPRFVNIQILSLIAGWDKADSAPSTALDVWGARMTLSFEATFSFMWCLREMIVSQPTWAVVLRANWYNVHQEKECTLKREHWSVQPRLLSTGYHSNKAVPR